MQRNKLFISVKGLKTNILFGFWILKVVFTDPVNVVDSDLLQYFLDQISD